MQMRRLTFFALLEILMKSVLPHHAHINKKMNDNNNNTVRSRSAAEGKKNSAVFFFRTE